MSNMDSVIKKAQEIKERMEGASSMNHLFHIVEEECVKFNELVEMIADDAQVPSTLFDRHANRIQTHSLCIAMRRGDHETKVALTHQFIETIARLYQLAKILKNS